MDFEIEAIAKGEIGYLKADVAGLLLSIVNDERINNFKVSAIILIEDFNSIVTGSPLIKNDAYDDFMKDGFVICDHLLSNARYYLENDFPEQVKEIEKRKNISPIKVVKPSKIKMKLNIDQFAYLIRLMAESDLFELPQKTEIGMEIIEHFSTKGAEDIGATSMVKKLSETEKAEAIYWEKLLKKWREKALKV